MAHGSKRAKFLAAAVTIAIAGAFGGAIAPGYAAKGVKKDNWQKELAECLRNSDAFQ